MDHIDGSNLRGRKVIDNRGTTIGEVVDVAIDARQWRVDGLVVEVERDVADDVNLHKPLMGKGPRLTVSTERIDALGDTVILNIDTNDIAALLRGNE